MKLLLLSNSTNFGQSYLGHAKQKIREFTASDKQNILFIPYAGITVGWDDYEKKVNQSLAEQEIVVRSIHHFNDPLKAVEMASLIMVGGGNTFRLLDVLIQNNLLAGIRKKIIKGTPFIGWSAGANMAGPTIQTTNDMPVVFPFSPRALELVPFQINPHFTEEIIPHHGGESRSARLLEFVAMNRDKTVVAIPEGVMLECTDGILSMPGKQGVKIFRYGIEPYWIFENDELTRLYNQLINENPDRTGFL